MALVATFQCRRCDRTVHEVWSRIGPYCQSCRDAEEAIEKAAFLAERGGKSDRARLEELELAVKDLIKEVNRLSSQTRTYG